MDGTHIAKEAAEQVVVMHREFAVVQLKRDGEVVTVVSRRGDRSPHCALETREIPPPDLFAQGEVLQKRPFGDVGLAPRFESRLIPLLPHPRHVPDQLSPLFVHLVVVLVSPQADGPIDELTQTPSRACLAPRVPKFVRDQRVRPPRLSLADPPVPRLLPQIQSFARHFFSRRGRLAS